MMGRFTTESILATSKREAGNMIEITAAYIDGNGALSQRTAQCPGAEDALKSHLQIVAFWIKRSEDENANPGPIGGFWWTEFSGNSAYACTEGPDGVQCFSHDSSGPDAGTRIRHFNVDHSVTPNRELPTKLADAMMGQGACWDCLDEGAGSTYTQKLESAKTLVGAP